ncbi:MAG: hypothetical protein P1P90_00840 [Patescibacteria group bacterium]|nr:hypothetical protein [Patescibacteria group bacterium]
MKLAKNQPYKSVILKDLEIRAQQYVQKKYFTSFFVRNEALIFLALIFLLPSVLGMFLADTLADAVLASIVTYSLILLNVLVGSFITAGTFASLYRYFKLNPGNTWHKKGGVIFTSSLNWLFMIVGGLFTMNLGVVGGIYIASKILLAINFGDTDPVVLTNSVILSYSISMPMMFITVAVRYLMVKANILPQSFVPERDKLRTASGAVARYLLDKIDIMEKESLAAIDELHVKGSLAVKRATELEAYFKGSIKQEKGSAPEDLLCSLHVAAEKRRALEESCDNLDAYREKVKTFYKGCRQEVELIEKRQQDAKKKKELAVFVKQVKQLPQQVDEFVKKNPNEILENAEELDKTMRQLRADAEIVATVESLPDASQESLEKLEEIIDRCINTEPPKLPQHSEDDDEN